MAQLTGDQKRKLYFKVLVLLIVLTGFELFIASSSLPKILVTILVVSASLSKAFAVGWIYMHLNHETAGLRTVLLFPLFVAFFYAAFLITDAKFSLHRHAHEYLEEPKRFFGQRNLHDRKLDEFGNPIPEEETKKIAQGSEIEEPKAESAKGTDASATSSGGTAGAQSPTGTGLDKAAPTAGSSPTGGAPQSAGPTSASSAAK